MQHVPSFIERAEELKSKGVAEIRLISGQVLILHSLFFLFSLGEINMFYS